MALTSADFGEYDYNRMVVRFTMKNDQADVVCAISTDAMDQLEGSSRTPPEQREQQFLRLRDRIEARAAAACRHPDLAWVLRHKSVTSALIGASRPGQVDDCVGATKNLNFTAGELAQIDQILA